MVVVATIPVAAVMAATVVSTMVVVVTIPVAAVVAAIVTAIVMAAIMASVLSVQRGVQLLVSLTRLVGVAGRERRGAGEQREGQEVHSGTFHLTLLSGP
jgi:hypothetical protein